jgi:hypothetical protein
LEDFQEDIDTVLYFLQEELGIDVVFANDEPNAYWHNGHASISISTKQSKRLQLYSMLHEAGHAIVRTNEEYQKIFPYGKKDKNKSISRRVDVLREEVVAWEEGRELAKVLKIKLDTERWHKFVKKNLFDYVRWAYDPKAFNANR